MGRTLDLAKHQAKTQQILDAAWRCFVRDGFRGASTTDICREAKISPGHLYHYFPSKEAIVEALTENSLQSIASHFDGIAHEEDVVKSLLSRLHEGFGKPYRPSMLLNIEMLAEASRNPSIAKILQRYTQRMRGLLADRLRDGQKRGQVDRQLDPDLAATILIGLVDGVRGMAIKDPSLDTAKTVELLKSLMSRLIAPCPAKNAALDQSKRRVVKTR